MWITNSEERWEDGNRDRSREIELSKPTLGLVRKTYFSFFFYEGVKNMNYKILNMKDILFGELVFRIDFDEKGSYINMNLEKPNDEQTLSKMRNHFIPLFKGNPYYSKFSTCAICGIPLHFIPALYRVLSKDNILCCICRDIINNRPLKEFCLGNEHKTIIKKTVKYQEQILQCCKCEKVCNWKEPLINSSLNLFKKRYINFDLISNLKNLFINQFIDEIQGWALGIKECWADVQIDLKHIESENDVSNLLSYYTKHILKGILIEITRLIIMVKLKSYN
jgi:hypothetical protein